MPATDSRREGYCYRFCGRSIFCSWPACDARDKPAPAADTGTVRLEVVDDR